MGDTWGKWFQTEPELDTIVPHQMMALVTRSLGRLKEHWQLQQQTEDVKAQATASYGILVGASKKARIEFEEACMGDDA